MRLRRWWLSKSKGLRVVSLCTTAQANEGESQDLAERLPVLVLQTFLTRCIDILWLYNSLNCSTGDCIDCTLTTEQVTLVGFSS